MAARSGKLAWAFALLAATATCDAPVNRPVAAQPTPSPRPRRFDPEVVRVAPTSPLGRALTAQRAGNPGRAREIAESALAETAAPEEAGRLRWVAAGAAEAAGDSTGARRHLETLGSSSHALAPWARLRGAGLLRDSDPREAARLAGTLTHGWAGSWRARILEATALAAAGQDDEAVPKLRTLVAESPDRVGAATPGMPLAAILEARDDEASRVEALSVYRRIATRAPLAAVGRDAAARAARILGSLPEARRRELEPMPVSDLQARARAFYESMHHEEAEEAYRELGARIDGDRAALCEAKLFEGLAILRRRDRPRGVTHMREVAEQCTDPDVRARARYHAGLTLAQLNRHREAMEEFDALAAAAADHSLADDALFRSALAARDAGDRDAMMQRLGALPERFPRGDMRGEARFALAWSARADGDLAAALTSLDASLAEGPGEEAEDIGGRTEYWRARTLLDLGRSEDAAEAFEAVARSRPLSFYAQLSLSRLTELDRARAEALRASLRPESEEPLTFAWRDEIDTEPFRRLLELLRVGASDLAAVEIEHDGFTSEGADADFLWLIASVLDRAGEHPRASRLARSRLRSFMRTAPRGQSWHLWRIAYPRPYGPLVEQTAGAEAVPPALVHAVMREESAFEPGALSTARAYGLMQLIEPTARRFARELSLPSTPAALLQPETNVRLGTRYLAFLWARYPQNRAVVPSAYNAGEGATDRWLRARPHEPLDVWIENIPYDETRRYTRRVLQSFGIYAWLDGGDFPAFSQQLPPPNR